MNEQPYKTDSILAIQSIPHEDLEGRNALEKSINEWLTQAEMAKWPRALQYFENVSYLLGNHFTRYYYDSANGFGFHTFGLHDKSSFDNLIAKVADNQLIRPVETTVALLTETQPMPRVEPNSDLPQDEDASAIAGIIVKLTFEKPLEMPEVRREAAMIAIICGTVAAETEYGETGLVKQVPKKVVRKKENPLFDPEEEEDEELNPREYEVEEVDGIESIEVEDMVTRLWTPLHFTEDPQATNERDLRYIARTSFEDIDWIKSKFDKKEDGYYPENLEGMNTDPPARHPLYWWTKIRDIIESPQYFQHGGGFSPTTSLFSGGYAPNQTTFTIVDVKPSIEYPRGRTLVVAGGKLIYCSPKEKGSRAWHEKYWWRWHNYSFFSWFKTPGKFVGMPLLTELVPLQKKINAIDALVQANRQFMSIGQWKIPRHSKVSEGYITGIPGQQIYHTAIQGLSEPEKVDHVPLPGELLEERAQLVNSINEIAASSVLDNEIAASAARAGVILDFLRNQKLKAKSPMIQDYEGFLEGIGQNVLIEYQINLTEENEDLTMRLRAAAREYPTLAIEAFTGASLRDHHHVTIDISSELLHSPEAMQSRALEYWQFAAAEASPAERDAVIRAVGLDRFLKNEKDASINRARRMISRIVAGELDAAYSMPNDDPMVMAPEFGRELSSDRFLELNQDQKQAIYGLWLEYSEQAAAMAQAEFERQLMLAGKAPEQQIKPA